MEHSEPWVLGISSSHNGAACLLKGDEIIAAIQEERVLRLPAPAFQAMAMQYPNLLAQVSKLAAQSFAKITT